MKIIFQHILKISTFILLGGFVTLSLFFLMQLLIRQNNEALPTQSHLKTGNISIPINPIVVHKREIVPEKITQPPDFPDIEDDFQESSVYITPTPAQITPLLSDLIFNLAIHDYAEFKPTVVKRTLPMYPPVALRKKIEGRVFLVFNITEEGLVENPQVAFSEPEGIFDQASLRAVKEWKFIPKVENGKNVKIYNFQQVMNFFLEE